MQKYCVYLTIYHGTRLPPFYIGYCRISRLKNDEYHGTVSSRQYKSIWDKEIAEYPELFKTIIIKQFDDKKSANDYEIRIQKKLDVVRNPLYINQKIWPNVGNKGVKFSDSHKKKLRNAFKKSKKHRDACIENLKQANTAESRVKMRKTLKKRYQEQVHPQALVCRLDKLDRYSEYIKECRFYIRQNMIKQQKEYIWINNGVLSKKIKLTDTVPDGYQRGRITGWNTRP